ncbi:MAG TPA: hypothetical protein VGD58_15795 [Herpetosiphonaceae bacterium]
MYLTREAVEHTLRTIAGTAGTVVAFDYFAAELVTSPSLFMRYARAVIKLTGEPFRFGIDNTPPVRERVAAFLASCGLVLEDQRNFGVETDRQRAMAGFVIAQLPATIERIRDLPSLASTLDRIEALVGGALQLRSMRWMGNLDQRACAASTG